MAYSLEQKMSKDKLIEFCRKNYIKKLSLFGSALRGSLEPESDVDILVEFEEGRTPGLFSIVRMEMELTEALGRKVDLRTPEDLSRYFRDELRKKANNIPWRILIGMRNRLIHTYFDINLDVVWSTSTEDIALLVTELEKLIG